MADGAGSQPDAGAIRELRRMKVVATGLLVGAAVLFAVAHTLEPRQAWWGYVRAFAEASMVGALADWFAVTALFRHPLRLRIPHTAIIPTRKDEIGRGLGTFVETNFLTPEVLGERLSGVEMAARLGAWLSEPTNTERATDRLMVLARAALDAIDEAEVRAALEAAIVERIRSASGGPLLGRALELAVADGRHQQFLGALLGRLGVILTDARPQLRRMLGRESPWWVPESVDDRVFEKAFDTVQRVLREVAADPHHELRVAFDRRVRELAHELGSSPELQARVDALKDELLDHPALRSWSASMWSDLRSSLERQLSEPDSELRSRVAVGVARIAERLCTDGELQAKVDAWFVSTAVGVAEHAGHEVGDLIATTVASWDANESSRRIELAVGRDLQFIRINGTVVGGLAGLVIYTLSRVFG